MSGIGKAAAEEAAWAKLQRSAVWWLGEHANAAALEYAGDNEAVKATAAINAAMQRTTSPGEIIAMQVLVNSDIIEDDPGLPPWEAPVMIAEKHKLGFSSSSQMG